MANVDRPRGFTPIGTLSGSPWQDSVQLFYLDGTVNTTTIAVGDIVAMAAGGYLAKIAAAGASPDVVGVVVGVPPAPPAFSTTTGTFGDNHLSNTEPTLAGAGSRHVAASTAGYVYVTTAPDLLMIGQEDGAATPLVLADVGAVVDIVDAGITASTGNSGMEIDSSSKGNTSNDPLRIVALANTPGNELASVDTTKPWADWVVTFNAHISKDITGI